MKIKIWKKTLLALITISSNVSGLLFGNQACSRPKSAADGLPYEEKVDYYVNLIGNQTEKAMNYELPTDNLYFYHGSGDPNVSKEYGIFDFIVVGAGTAGGTVAYELAKSGRWSVLLIEAGGDQTDFSDIPAMFAYLQSSRMNWGYYSTPQTNSCQSMKGKQCFYPRGKVTGGTGTLNALMYVRGNKEDYNSWEAAGNPGWSYEDILPIFKSQENSRLNADTFYHGKGGPINTEYPRPKNPLLNTFIEANEAVGRHLVDYNAAEQIGVSHTQFFLNDGKRESSGRVYIDRALCWGNFHYLQKAYVTKILIDDRKRAYGVSFFKNGQKYLARARKEVIISSGSVNTPQLLLLSGIGPKKELENLGIEVKNDLSGVGKNLQDHPTFFGLSFKTNYTIFNATNEENVEWYLEGLGPLTNPSSNDGLAFLKFNDSKLPIGVPDSEIILVAPNSTNDYTPIMLNADDESRQSFWDQIEPQNTFFVFTSILHPKSRGSITLKSNDPFYFPNIDLNFLAEEEDIEDLYKAVQLVLEIAASEPFKRINATYINTNISDCNTHAFLSKDYWYCNLKHFSATIYHPTSTAKMGPKNDPEAVVDHRLRVHGIKNLRVADCSIIPHATSGNTNAPAFMIGKKAALVIKEDHFLEI